MEHEVVVPLPVAAVREALQDHELLARCIPGLSTDAAPTSAPDGPVLGRLRLRIGGSTITYRGSLSLIEGRAGVLTALVEGQESRGTAEATATVRLSVQEHADGSALRFSGDLSAEGRLTELPAESLEAAGRRLLDRFARELAGELGGVMAPVPDEAATEEPVEPVAEEPVAVEEPTVEEPAAEEPATEEPAAEEDEGEEGEEETSEDAEADAEATVVYLEDHALRDLDDDLSDLIAFSDEDDDAPGTRPPTGEPEPEPAPVRRSIVGRSAEEVDHAPPHGRYAPTPPSRSARARAASRWGGAEPTLLTNAVGERNALPWVIGGGVALLGGAVVLVRALRRR